MDKDTGTSLEMDMGTGLDVDAELGIISAQEAAEAAKGLTFEIVWAALMEDRRAMAEMRAETKKRDEEYNKRMEESQKRMEESRLELEKTMAKTDKQLGRLGNSVGLITESLFSEGLDKKFNELGYPFTKQGPHVKFKEEPNGRVLAEADYFLEDGEYAMAVEVKTELKVDDVKDHVERLAVIRKYFDERGDNRILVGAVAGGKVHESVLRYAQKQGLYVITQSGDSAVIAELPEGFKAREW